MRCPDCHEPISWVPQPDGIRIAISIAPDPGGSHFLDGKGILRPVIDGLAPWPDVPRYVLHVPCPVMA